MSKLPSLLDKFRPAVNSMDSSGIYEELKEQCVKFGEIWEKLVTSRSQALHFSAHSLSLPHLQWTTVAIRHQNEPAMIKSKELW